jgi:hypothetical protein
MDKRHLVRACGESRERDGAVGQGRTTPDDADFAGCSPRTRLKLSQFHQEKNWCSPGGNCWPVQPRPELCTRGHPKAGEESLLRQMVGAGLLGSPSDRVV